MRYTSPKYRLTLKDGKVGIDKVIKEAIIRLEEVLKAHNVVDVDHDKIECFQGSDNNGLYVYVSYLDS